LMWFEVIVNLVCQNPHASQFSCIYRSYS